MAKPQSECFAAGVRFARAEGILPAPEPAHAVAACIEEALRCKQTGEEKVILTALCGHGLLDLAAYGEHAAGQLRDQELSDQVIEAALAGPGDDCPVVVVTHHAPHPLCVPAAHRSSWGAGNSASDLSHLTDTGRAALWVHGHLHHTVDLVRPGGTRILCNPAGPRLGNADFHDDLVAEV